MEKEKTLSKYQINLLEFIVNNSVETISYHNPQRQLKDVVANKSRDETSDALRSLETKFRVLSLDPTLRFGLLNKCGYRVINLGKARELYDSYEREKRE